MISKYLKLRYGNKTITWKVNVIEIVQNSLKCQKILCLSLITKTIIHQPVWWELSIKTERAVVVQSLSHVRLFVTPWTTACRASLSFPISQTLLKFMSIESVMLSMSSSAALFSTCPQSFPASGSFPMSQLFASGGQSIGVSASAPILPMNIQDWFPLGLTGLISLQSKGLSRVFSNTTVQKHQFFGTSLLYSPTLTSIHDYEKTLVLTIQTFVSKVMS